jgi:SAM-dependent methyltransferase
MSLAARLAQRVRRLLRAADDWLRDWREGMDTRGRIEVDRIVTASPNRARGVRYQASPVRALRTVLDALDAPAGQAFVDIGAGKGRVLLLAARYPFARLIGVEYSPPLCDIARRNLARARLPMPAEVICIDAADYAFPDDAGVVYLFNPFDAVVLARVIDNLRVSLQRAPRPFRLVYHFPRWHGVLDDCDFLERIAVHRIGGDEFAVYAMKPRSELA